MLKLKVIEHGSADWRASVKLREKILRAPLGASFSEEELEQESEDLQIAGYINEQLVVTAVLVREEKQLKMQRVAVDDGFRNKGIGAQLLTFCENIAVNKNYHSIYCHARNTAVKFYQDNGYTAEGDFFNEDGIPHLKMRKALVIDDK